MELLALSDIGLKRTVNEDALAVLAVGEQTGANADFPLIIRGCGHRTEIRQIRPPLVAVVIDGMGGMGGGDTAAGIVAERFAAAVAGHINEGLACLETILPQIFMETHGEIINMGRDEARLATMGAALAGYAVDASGEYLVFHAGDARVYRCRSGYAEPLTRDHALPGHGPLTNCIGGGMSRDTVFLEMRRPGGNRLEAGQTLLACSDGLHAFIDENALDEIITASEQGHAMADKICEMVRTGQAPDNFSVVMARG